MPKTRDEAAAALRAVGELRTLLREWSQHDDAALVLLTGHILRHYGFWDDDDHDAAVKWKNKFHAGADPDLCAYDGSNMPQKRALTARERDTLCRVLNDIIHGWEHADRRAHIQRCIRWAEQDLDMFQMIRFVLDPRDD